MSVWGPTPQKLAAINLTAELIGCHQLATASDPTFGSDFLILVDRTKNQYGDPFMTLFDGTLKVEDFLFTDLVIVGDLYTDTGTTLNFASPVLITQTVRTPLLLVQDTTSTGTTPSLVILGAFLQPSTSSSSYVNFTYEQIRLRFYPAATPYALIGFSSVISTASLQIYSNKVNILSELSLKTVIVNPVSTLGPYTPVYTTNPTGSTTFTTNKTSLNRIDINYRNLTKTTDRGTVFIQFGEGTSYGSNTYSGLSMGNFAVDLGTNFIVASNTNGFPLLNDYMDVNFVMNGTVTLYKMGTTSSGGQRWVIQSSSYIYYDNVSGVDNIVSFGAGYIETTSTYPGITSFRFQCASTASPGLLSNGVVNVLTV